MNFPRVFSLALYTSVTIFTWGENCQRLFWANWKQFSSFRCCISLCIQAKTHLQIFILIPSGFPDKPDTDTKKQTIINNWCAIYSLKLQIYCTALYCCLRWKWPNRHVFAFCCASLASIRLMFYQRNILGHFVELHEVVNTIQHYSKGIVPSAANHDRPSNLRRVIRTI